MAVLLAIHDIHDSNKNTIDDTVTSDIGSINDVVAPERVEELQNGATSSDTEEPNPMENIFLPNSIPPPQEAPRRLFYTDQTENVEEPIDRDDLHSSSSDECSYFCEDDITNSVSDGNSSFSSDWSSVSDTEFQFDFEDQNSIESDRFVCRPSCNDENSTGSDNTWSVWGVDTMTKFWNGTRSKIVEPAIMKDLRASDGGENQEKLSRRLESYEYWYNNSSYGTRRSLTAPTPEYWTNMNDDSFDVQRAILTMQSARFLDNPRLEFLIVQKLLRNANDDEGSISMLTNLNKRGLLRKSVVYDCVENALHETPSRLEASFRLFVEICPQVLKERPLFHTFLLHCYTRDEHPDVFWKRFLALLALGLAHFSEDLGFLFHKDYNSSSSILPKCSSPFEMACVIFGRGRVIKAVGDIITKRVELISDPNAVATWVIAAATKENITLDALYFLMRREPVSTLQSLQFALKNGRHEQ